MASAVATKIPTCHPDFPYMARGLCRRCYVAQRNGREPKEGPIRAYNFGLSRPDKITLPVDLGPYCFTAWPETCPKCKKEISLVRNEGNRELWCTGLRGGCGWTGYLVTEPITLTEPKLKGER